VLRLRCMGAVPRGALRSGEADAVNEDVKKGGIDPNRFNVEHDLVAETVPRRSATNTSGR
jgi:hypothetical protein